MKLYITLFTLLTLSFSTLEAKEVENQSWIVNLSFGTAKVDYIDSIQNKIDSLISTPVSKNISLALDIYTPVSNHILLGLATQGSTDIYVSSDAATAVSARTFTLAGSLIYFTNTLEDGFFIRADLGSVSNTVQDSNATFFESGTGLSSAFGVGIAYDLGKTSITATALFTTANIQGQGTKGSRLFLSIMF